MPSPHILTEGRNCWRIAKADRLAFLIDGAAYFAAFTAAAEQARESIFIVGWDVDSRMSLRPDAAASELPNELGAFLKALTLRRRSLHVYILEWDFAFIFALEREPAVVRRRRWQGHRRIHYHEDGAHPAGASHHQKLVVIDDAVAFIGGIDLSNRRWDTPAHLAEDAQRVDVDGLRYPPVHDVQVAVEGEVAAALGDLARERWRRATGRRPRAPLARGSGLWPPKLWADLEAVPVAIARTEPGYNGHPQVREVEGLYLAAIKAARRFIYMEAQYFTAAVIGEALEHRLAEQDGPEVILVLPRKASGWLEQQTMDVLRTRLLQRLTDADRFGRLRLCCPTVPGLDERCINVHSKVLIVDDRLVRVGSANVSNRSMGLDTECDIAIEAAGDSRIQRAIAHFRNRLVGEHLGVAARDVAEILCDTHSLIAAVDKLRGLERKLEPLAIGASTWRDRLIPDIPILDPESPIVPEPLLESCGSPDDRRAGKIRLLSGVLAFMIVVGLAAAWRWTPLGTWLDVESLAEWVTFLRGQPLAPFVILGAYVIGGLVLFPVTVLIMATALACGPLLGFAYSLTGCLLSATLTYGLGYFFGHDIIRSLPGARLGRLSQRLAQHGFVAILLVRIVPVAPFTVVNMVAGAAHIRLRNFILGTCVGMLPGLLVMTVFGGQLEDFIRQPNGGGVFTLIGLLALLGFLTLWVRRRFVQTDALQAPEIAADE
jgi:phosphatidylserine/phosphatidylglycerophosphate/cardiolipin synthase-like enzyme/uncharacterized membrane protein YdjX (TVP38/TMEM64 family)